MLADDPLGSRREQALDPVPTPYLEAFRAIDGDANQRLVVAILEGRPAGMMQVTFIPSLTYKGRWRAQLEGVRVRSDLRGGGLGRAMMEEAVALARSRACHVLQLTTDKKRPGAIAFYEGLGFEASHEGMKLHLR
ncbi:MAG: GNAT family N-acetyltransferase [Gemmatimonadetes bacterium]|nr:GNAT family N-acetyltransferase [Gemmatimonadota bacterium]